MTHITPYVKFFKLSTDFNYRLPTIIRVCFTTHVKISFAKLLKPRWITKKVQNDLEKFTWLFVPWFFHLVFLNPFLPFSTFPGTVVYRSLLSFCRRPRWPEFGLQTKWYRNLVYGGEIFIYGRFVTKVFFSLYLINVRIDLIYK